MTSPPSSCLPFHLRSPYVRNLFVGGGGAGNVSRRVVATTGGGASSSFGCGDNNRTLLVLSGVGARLGAGDGWLLLGPGGEGAGGKYVVVV